VFYLSPNAGPSQLAGRGCHPNYFNVAWQNDNLHEAAGAYANTLGYENSFILAPNYPGGAGRADRLQALLRGRLAGELYTQLGQTDYAAEIAQIRASGADSVFFFLPGGMGISFLKQYADSGVEIPVIGPAFSFDQGILAGRGRRGAGRANTSQWSQGSRQPDQRRLRRELPGRIWPAALALCEPGLRHGEPASLGAGGAHPSEDPDAFREALRAADFDSTRGDFAFGPNHHPIQDIYAREVVQRGRRLTNRIIGWRSRTTARTPTPPSARCDPARPGVRLGPDPREGASMSTILIIEQVLNGLQFGVMLFLMAAGLTLIFGVMGLINLAHGSLYMVGAFAAAAVAGATGSFLLPSPQHSAPPPCGGRRDRDRGDPAALPGRPSRPGAGDLRADPDLFRGHALVFGSFPLFLDIPDVLSGPVTLPGGIQYPLYRLTLIGIGLAVALGLWFADSRTRIGIQIRAGENDREMIAALGVDISRLYTLVFALGAALAGLAGALVGAIQSVRSAWASRC
jgi:hypothetical protein